MIKNIIFDVGKVLVSYEPDEYMDRIGFDEQTKAEVNRAMFQNELWNESDRGATPQEEILQKMIENAPDYKEQILQAYENVGETIELLPYVEDWVKELKEKGYRLYILSNYAEKTYNDTKHKMKFLPYMDGVVFSFQCKKIKPEPEIYQYLLETFNLKPEESIFIDDRSENIQEAQKQGIHGIHFQSYTQAKKELKNLINR